MVDNLARLSVAKDRLNITGTSQDARILALIAAVSGGFQGRGVCRRSFAATVGTRYPLLPIQPHMPQAELWVDDVVSLSTVLVDANSDGVAETAIVEGTDFILWPYARDNEPYIRLDRVGTGASWPSRPRGVALTGVHGYSYQTELTGSLLAASLNDSATTVALTAAGPEVGEIIVVGSEQMRVSAALATSPFTLTLVRAQNGTTAAAHSNNDPVYRRRYPAPVEEATVMQLSRMKRELEVGLAGNLGGEASGAFSWGGLPSIIRDLLGPYRRPVWG